MHLSALNEPAQVVTYRWASSPRCVALARAELAALLARWSLTGISDVALLILSELLTNAVRHARVRPGRHVETRFLRTEIGVRIEVHDGDPAGRPGSPPRPRESGGLGLLLVAELADTWGVAEHGEAGKAVWAELAGSKADGAHHGD